MSAYTVPRTRWRIYGKGGTARGQTMSARGPDRALDFSTAGAVAGVELHSALYYRNDDLPSAALEDRYWRKRQANFVGLCRAGSAQRRLGRVGGGVKLGRGVSAWVGPQMAAAEAPTSAVHDAGRRREISGRATRSMVPMLAGGGYSTGEGFAGNRLRRGASYYIMGRTEGHFRRAADNLN